MNLSELIVPTIRVSIALTSLAVGLHSLPKDVTYLLRRPGLLARSLVSMNLIMLAVALVCVQLFQLKPVIEIVLVALALSPMPPFLPGQIMKKGGRQDYTISLMAITALLAIILVPLTLSVLSRIFNVPMTIEPAAVLKLVLITVILPLGAGMAIRALAPAFSARAADPVAKVGLVLLILGLAFVVPASFDAIKALIGDGTLASFAGFCLIGLSVGHLLGGSDPGTRTVLAFCTACRHPGMAITITMANFQEPKLALPAVLLYLFMSAIVSAVYTALTRHRPEAPAAEKSAARPGKGGPTGLKPA